MEGQVWWHNSGWIIIFFIATAIFGTAAGLIQLAFPKVDRDKERLGSIELAKSICSFRQRVSRVKVYSPRGMLIIDLVADDEEMKEIHLAFDREHPDFEHLAEITGFGVLRFDFQETPIPGLNPQDATAYLRLKK